ncbi:hypothetical protein DL765_004548 [Monosporascus sp. GIB2]|nr:hypothetical protein DL765_004548 [Monosporascus sp. GIB2]
MLRQPPGEGRLVAQQRKVLLALAFILLPWIQIVDAQQQQRQQQPSPQQAPIAAHVIHNNVALGQNDDDLDQGRHAGHPRQESSPFEGRRAVDDLVATSLKAAINARPTPNSNRDNTVTSHEKESFGNSHIPYDASALATLAPAQPVRAPSSPRQLPSLLAGAGLSSPQSARSLENWEVEDFVLLATVDGHLYAVNRTSGEERWHLQVEQPVVETIQHKLNSSGAGGGGSEEDNHHPLDDYIFAVEPTRNGALYVWTPSGLTSGLMNTGFTMKQLVDDLGPYAVQNPPVVYTGHKRTTMITLDAATGRVFKWFGQSGSQVDQTATCYRPDGRLVDTDSDECSNSGTITLSRTEYTVTIHRLDDGRAIATLKYSEWGPNNSDYDLHQQYRVAHRNRYITSKTDGKLFALDPSGLSPLVLQSSSPVAHVFDIARPEDTPAGGSPELVVLPQPAPPSQDDEAAHARSHRVFLNQTESGSWYAMSGVWYPLILEAPTARINRRNWWDVRNTWDALDEAEVNDALVGTHTLGNVKNMVHRPPRPPPGLPAGSYSGSHEVETTENSSTPPSPMPHDGADTLTIVDKVIALPQKARDSVIELMVNPISITIILGLATFKLRDMIHKWKRKRNSKDYLDASDKVQPRGESFATVLDTAPAAPGGDKIEGVHVGPQTEGRVDAKRADAVVPVVAHEPARDDVEPEQPLQDAESPEKKPKKAHRGRRGGVKHRKGPKKQQDRSESRGDSASPDIDDTIPGIKNVGVPPKLEPNVITLKSNPEDVSGPIIEIGGIEVNQDEQLGMGSNGTVVFAGKFHGRDVAVKRMLTQFWDIATQETQLLLESDHHPNVIRYFAMSRNESFLYIALELCQASLSDVIDKPHMFRELAQAGEMDLPHVLLQIANGLSFLHDLRIVHRDLKPQNILVTMGRDGKPRLLVSDFGLCKKLEGGQSSFGATTAHAAGTSGWRAPELLLDDDAREGSVSMASTHSDSSQLVSSDVMPNRRATRSIDIFSLGLVFFYVLTKGSHPFDCGDRYMREVNIRKGQFNLAPLDVLGDVAYEAKALVEAMLQSDPRARPSAKDVMAHPFFWSAKERLAFLCDVSDHFELEQRDPPSEALSELEHWAPKVCRGDFLKLLPKEFVDSLGKQRKYTGSKLLDLLRALRNKRFHYGDMSDSLKKMVGPLPDGYLGFWTRRFPNLLIVCCRVVYRVKLQDTDTFREYFKPRTPL